MFFALYLLYAVRVLHIPAGLVGLLLGVAALGGLLGALVTKRIAARIGVGWAYAAGCSPRRWCCGRSRTGGWCRCWRRCSRPNSPRASG